eukprot:snap_masked-scaffold_5-processed-gene-5.40-mRNA-1 protein AED:1.00 eAED:1.00 QI:0/0/0/0/1/1/2/0/65
MITKLGMPVNAKVVHNNNICNYTCCETGEELPIIVFHSKRIPPYQFSCFFIRINILYRALRENDQ